MSKHRILVRLMFVSTFRLINLTTNNHMSWRSSLLWVSLLLVGLASTGYVYLQTTWSKMPGQGYDVGANASGKLVLIGTEEVEDGRTVYQWDGSKFYPMAGKGGVRIDIDTKNQPWIVTSTHEIYRHDGTAWVKMPGAANDVGCGSDGSVYIIGTAAFPGGYKIYKWNGGDWNEVGGQGGIRVDVGNDGNAWVVTEKGSIHQRVGNLWRAYPGYASDIGIGPKGQAWVVGKEGQVYQWNTGNWIGVSVVGESIAVGQNNKAFVVNDKRDIYKVD
jgi:Tectonin domain